MLIDFSTCNTIPIKNNDIAQVNGLVIPPKPSNTQGPSRSRQRRRIRGCMHKHNNGLGSLFFMAVAFLVHANLPVAASAPGAKWLQQRLLQIAAKHLETPSLPIEMSATPPLDTDSSEDTITNGPPLLVVATHEGQVWTIDSTDGNVLAGFSTGPPLLVIDDYYEPSTPNEDGEEEAHPPIPTGLTQSQIVPSMDGILYWRQPISPSSQQSGGGDNDSSHGGSSSNTKLVPIAAIRDLVDNPIQICQDGDGENCDILTATSLGPSLFSLNAQGSLNWARARGSSTSAAASAKPVPMERTSSSSSSGTLDDEDYDDTTSSDTDDNTINSDTSGPKTSLLLQRQDYLVQQISTETGEQVWNITWGSLEALDFMGQDNQDGGGTGARRSGRHNNNVQYLPSSSEPVPSSLPSLIFANQGKSLVAVWAQPPKFLWKRDFISVVTNVLAIERGSWGTVNVVAENDGLNDDDGRLSSRGGSRKYPPLLSRSEDHESSRDQKQKDIDRWYWFWAGGSSGMGKKSKSLDLEEQYYIHPQEENGLVFVPRPNAHQLVRNSWYLNHLWESPQARSDRSFQGLLTDYAHNEQEEGEPDSKQDYKQAQRKHGLVTPAPPQRLDHQLFDTTNMPRLLLLPPTGHPELLGLPSPSSTGGVFLSWTVVIAIITALVGSAGVAYIIYGQKKRKWMAERSLNPTDQENTQSSNPELTGATVTMSPLTPRSRSVSVGQDVTVKENALNGSDSNLGLEVFKPLSLGNLPRHMLNRSSSAPLFTRDDIKLASSSNEGVLSLSKHRIELPAPITRRATSPVRTENVSPGQLVKHQSAPVETPLAPQGGVGMIDGIPLIRYSRYQAEFRELEPLGRGGFGTVFRVCNVMDGREYAVKKVSIRSNDWVSPGTEAFSQELHRVLREVKFLALLDHPNIVRYYTAWLEMEEKDEAERRDDGNNNPKTLSRRFSSELLTGLDQTFGDGESQTCASILGKSCNPSISARTPSHLKTRNASNPLGWGNDFGNFEESSASAYYPKHTFPVVPSMEDCGFIFEEGSEDGGEDHDERDPSYLGLPPRSFRGRSVASSEQSESHSVSSSWDASYSLNRRQKKSVPASGSKVEGKQDGVAKGEEQSDKKSTSRLTLYIQMQLCSPKTLGDFLANKEARLGPAATRRSASSSGTVDIPCALRLFLQIVQAVQHVHEQGLIHRDLKPSNCFIDETGTVKVGDFGLSREAASGDNSESPSLMLDGDEDFAGADNTAGVGTRSYASPEQMNGSDYDLKTDIYSLGVMLFELLYPMYTGMERQICFQQLRGSMVFPDGWHLSVASPFPTLNVLVRSMLSLKPKDRPTADKIARNVQALLEEHSVTLNMNHQDGDNEHVIFIRVEAKPLPDVLKSAIQFIHDAAAPKAVDIVQYGMRSSTKAMSSKSTDDNDKMMKPQKRSILEFAIASSDVEPSGLTAWGSSVVGKLEEYDEILVARLVWHQKTQSSYWNDWSTRDTLR